MTKQTKEIPKKNTNPYARLVPEKYFRCGKPGHRSNECPARRQVNLAEHTYCENDLEDEPQEDEGICEPDGGDDYDKYNYVVRKVMLAPKHEDNTQCHNLFRTTCTIFEKIFDLIVDGGSCENIIFRDIAKLLQLPVEKHPEPYVIKWIKEVKGIKVTEHCKVPLSIGKYYRDEVVCDILDMDACHILFGRPWQYDLDATHSGKDNIYHFVKDGIKITLLPLKGEIRPKASRVEGKNFLTITSSEYDFNADIKQSREVHALIVKPLLMVEEEKKDKELPTGVQLLLDEFKELMSEELPAGLPPMQDIQHHIDLVPGAWCLFAKSATLQDESKGE
ncbi:uncharacterized protein [Elaeis guineensis]|uniref:uncharacterized protein n=1 Tax=Elaeis guineensis var. tenera TaxID=51953 RepID=UPI00094FA63B